MPDTGTLQALLSLGESKLALKQFSKFLGVPILESQCLHLIGRSRKVGNLAINQHHFELALLAVSNIRGQIPPLPDLVFGVVATKVVRAEIRN